MFRKTMAALIAAIVLTASYASVQAQTGGRGCVNQNGNEEGALSALPAWRVC